jgi:carbamoyl-phosphate synthase large subunit
MKKKIKKVLLLGSGALKIGEAGEFDYSGSQAIKALKEEGLQVIVVNPNIATVQTSEKFADKVYFLPVTPKFVEKVIEKEKPDGILLAFGGQTALNCGVELYNNGILMKHGVKVLGTTVQTIEASEDRHLFVKKLDQIKVKTPTSNAVNSTKKALQVAKKIGYPVMVRVAYALGGKGSGIAQNKKELKEICDRVFSFAPQALVEEYLGGWKEVEYEVVRDQFDNCITVCNMENFDPLGIHTGESIVVAPSQTLTNSEYHKLRELSIRIIRHLGIVGECNVQFALDPKSEDYRVIEVNARLSRSSALASKATGYPLAFVAAKLALGYSLPELRNSITKVTTACFEPALDYCVVKIPRWDLKKFHRVSKRIGSGMKSVGEVMAVGRKFEEALQKAIRMLNVGMNGFVANDVGFKNLKKELNQPTDERLFAITLALQKGYSVEQIFKLSKIDKWFLYKLQNIVELEKELKAKKLGSVSRNLMLRAKQLGYSDKQIALLLKSTEQKVRRKRKSFKLRPAIKQIDSLAAEFPARTNYLYLTYNGSEDDVKPLKKAVMVLGSGAYSIGSSVEFDWCCVNAVQALKRAGYKTIMVNFNPETVSTDYDICDKLFFDELSLETVLDIYEREKPLGAIVSMGGQIPNTLALKLHQNGVRIIGTKPQDIDRAENRFKFSKMLDKINVAQPKWKELSSIKAAKKFARDIEYPVLVRPSYVLSGSAMNVAFDDKSLEGFLKKAAHVSKDCPVVISKFIVNAKEIEFDGVAKNGKPVIYAISEHLENAGVHSGDATMVFPSQRTYLETINRIKEISAKVAKALNINGPFNIQFIAKDNDVKVIECNLRCSRSFPFVSKVSGNNFIDVAVKAMLGKKVPEVKFKGKLDYMGIKAPQFSFHRLQGADPVLRVEMASTGEVACMGRTFYDALLKSFIATGVKMPGKNVLLGIGGEQNRFAFLKAIKRLKEMGFNIFATEHTSKFLKEQGIANKMLYKVHEKKEPNVMTYLQKKKLDFVINIPNHYKPLELDDAYQIRRTAVDFSVPLITNLQLAKAFIKSMQRHEGFEIASWQDYLKQKP